MSFSNKKVQPKEINLEENLSMFLLNSNEIKMGLNNLLNSEHMQNFLKNHPNFLKEKWEELTKYIITGDEDKFKNAINKFWPPEVQTAFLNIYNSPLAQKLRLCQNAILAAINGNVEDLIKIKRNLPQEDQAIVIKGAFLLSKNLNKDQNFVANTFLQAGFNADMVRSIAKRLNIILSINFALQAESANIYERTREVVRFLCSMEDLRQRKKNDGEREEYENKYYYTLEQLRKMHGSRNTDKIIQAIRKGADVSTIDTLIKQIIAETQELDYDPRRDRAKAKKLV